MNKKAYWVKKLVPKRKWNEIYSNNNSYCFLETVNGDPVVGFCAGQLDEECRICSPEDLRKIDLHRMPNNVYPRPLQAVGY